MNIALISFEFPPSVAIGGIGTYTWNASRMLAEGGASVVVFSAGRADDEETPHPGVSVHRVGVRSREDFPETLVPRLLACQQRRPFDVIEAPEIGPEGVFAFRAVPTAGRVVKLHTPSFLVRRFGYAQLGPLARLRFWAGALRRGRWDTLPRANHRRENDSEYQGILLADEIAAPSRDIGRILGREWALDPARLNFYPLPLYPAPALLALAPPRERPATVGFLGRLEERKGVVEMAQAIPAILREVPSLRFRFIGPSLPCRRGDMRSWIESRLSRHTKSLEFTGPVSPEVVPGELARCDAIVLPSHWENFPYSCWESLLAGRAVIGSSAGGMAEVIEHETSGILVPPYSAKAIARAVVALHNHPGRAASLGVAGRARIQSLLAPERILPLQMQSYERAIHMARLRQKLPT